MRFAAILAAIAIGGCAAISEEAGRVPARLEAGDPDLLQFDEVLAQTASIGCELSSVVAGLLGYRLPSWVCDAVDRLGPDP